MTLLRQGYAGQTALKRARRGTWTKLPYSRVPKKLRTALVKAWQSVPALSGGRCPYCGGSDQHTRKCHHPEWPHIIPPTIWTYGP